MHFDRYLKYTFAGLALFTLTPAFGFEPVQITAEQAFDAVQKQKNPLTNASSVVALVDTRTRAEYFWVGTAAQVDKIIFKNINDKEISVAPDLGKVKLNVSGKLLSYKVNGNARTVPLDILVE